MRNVFLLLAIATLLNSCMPKVSSSIKRRYNAIEYNEKVRVLGLKDTLPSGAEILGTVKVGDTGFTYTCDWGTITGKATDVARKAGGNAIKITRHRTPSKMGSSCHRIQAQILRVPDTELAAIDSALLAKEKIRKDNMSGAGYALLHIYRQRGAGAFLSYNIRLGDKIIARARDNWKTTILLTEEGIYTIWAKTEIPAKLPIDIRHGNEYYIRCALSSGLFIYRPKLEMPYTRTGRAEFEAVKHGDIHKDIIVLKDGGHISCTINKHDDSFYYFTLNRDGKDINTTIEKEQIKLIHINKK
jgi:hypothetical protein